MINLIQQKDHVLWFKLNGFTRLILSHSCSGIVPYYIVNEYPKSGGSWVGEMLSSALNVPFPRNRLPMLKSSILHEHSMRSWNTRNMVIVWRDGRDVLISQYFHWLIFNDKGNTRLVEKSRLDLGFQDYYDVSANLMTFMEYVYTSNPHPGYTWMQFVNRWKNCANCVHVRYEDLRENPERELNRVLRLLNKNVVSNEKLRDIVNQHSFEVTSGRKVGEERADSFMRKGVVGDWKNYFTPQTSKKFLEYAGSGLVELGYENDDSWADSGLVGTT